MKDSVLMWEENDQAEVVRLKEALASATEPIRRAVANYVRWEGPKMWWSGNEFSETEYSKLYFWLCGYGDRMAVEVRKQPVCKQP